MIVLTNMYNLISSMYTYVFTFDNFSCVMKFIVNH